MGVITLTDRISVRVSAKNTSQSNDYKKATGGAIGKTLGNEDISDELKTQLGNTTKPVITDEDGNAWISMADIIAAGKKMNENGAFEEKTTCRYGNVACMPVTGFPSAPVVNTVDAWGKPNRFYDTYGPIGITVDGDGIYAFNDPAGVVVGCVHNINDDSYTLLAQPSFHTATIVAVEREYGNTSPFGNGESWGTYLTHIGGGEVSKWFVPTTDVGQTLLSLPAYGDYHEETHGGSLIDWTKSDAEIEEDIRQLHETWDVSEHEGAVMAIGTYVLAGPIEYNDADPTQGPPGSVG